jgi:hypothetical protein
MHVALAVLGALVAGPASARRLSTGNASGATPNRWATRSPTYTPTLPRPRVRDVTPLEGINDIGQHGPQITAADRAMAVAIDLALLR